MYTNRLLWWKKTLWVMLGQNLSLGGGGGGIKTSAFSSIWGETCMDCYPARGKNSVRLQCYCWNAKQMHSTRYWVCCAGGLLLNQIILSVMFTMKKDWLYDDISCLTNLILQQCTYTLYRGAWWVNAGLANMRPSITRIGSVIQCNRFNTVGLQNVIWERY
jgi:hypothetical protein